MSKKPIQPQSAFTWIPFFEELADKLSQWRERQPELIEFLESLREQGFAVTTLMETKAGGGRGLMTEIDPFTVIGIMNRGIRQEDRFAIARAFREKFGLSAASPEDFDGVPLLNNMSSRFVRQEYEREDYAVSNLWDVFQRAIKPEALEDDQFLASLDKAFSTRGVNVNLTMALFWIRPDEFVNLDSIMRPLLKIKLPSGGLTADFYKTAISAARSMGGSIHELSYREWVKASDKTPKPSASPEEEYIRVSAYWKDHDVPDRTARFVEEGI